MQYYKREYGIGYAGRSSVIKMPHHMQHACGGAFLNVIGNCVLLHKKRSAKEVHLAEMKLVINDTARARKSPTSGLFFMLLLPFRSFFQEVS